MRRGISIFLVSLTATLLACGLSVVGAGDGVLDASAPDGSSSGSSGSGTSGGTDGSLDAPLDAPSCTSDLATDPLHCGACGHDCLGGACVAGECQPIVFASGESGARGVAAVGTRLLWTRESAGLVRTKPLAGGDATTLIASVTGPTDVTGDAQRIYVVDRAAGKLSRWQADGGAEWSISPFDTPTGVTMDGTSVYFTIQNQDHVKSIDLEGTVAMIQTRMSGLNYPADVAVSGGQIFAASGSGILAAPAAGGTPVTNVSPTSRFKDGGGALIHTGLAVDGATIWFTIDSLGIVASIPTSGGTAKVLASNQASPQGIAVSNDAIYWANRSDGTIMKLAR